MSLVKDAPHRDITYKIIGAAMDVHNKLGPGHKEIVYQKALSAKMLEAGLSFEEEKPIEIFFDDISEGSSIWTTQLRKWSWWRRKPSLTC